MFQRQGNHAPHIPWEGLLQSAEEESVAVSQTSDTIGTMRFFFKDQQCTLARVLEGAWEFVYVCFGDLEKVYDCAL